MGDVKRVSETSPALEGKSGYYPASWRGKVPKRIRMAKTVTSDYPFDAARIRANIDCEYDAWVNSHGALAAVLPGGELLGLKPYEFDVIEWHESSEEGRA